MSNCCPEKKKSSSKDLLLYSSLSISVICYLSYMLSDLIVLPKIYINFSASIYELLNKMWWGVLLGIIFVGVLSRVPREFILSILGRGDNVKGILRATLAGVLLDLCSHGILMVGMKLYERGATIGQVMAFLIASPWNSFSLTLILIALIGIKWTLLFIILSMLIAILSGVIFQNLVKNGTLPENPNTSDIPEDFDFFSNAKKELKGFSFNTNFIKGVFVKGFKESKMILKWIFFGVILAALIKTFLSTEHFQTFFGPTLIGLSMTIIAATIIEVCSEGSTPIAADLLSRANAPGNSFAFLMAGVSTDYTEIMSIKERTASWKIALFLPLVTLPQIILISWMINNFS
ncbi:permease [Rickettsiales bacterium]|nr:permease [Rickettsiales bacterium]